MTERWDCVVLPDVIDAPNENIARIEFIRALTEDMDMIHVSPHIDDGVDPEFGEVLA